MSNLPFGLSPDQLQAIGLALFGFGFFALVLYFGEDVTYRATLWIVLIVTTGSLMVGYGSALSGVEDGRW